MASNDTIPRKPQFKALGFRLALLKAARRLEGQGTLPTLGKLVEATRLTPNQVRYHRRQLGTIGQWPWLADSIKAERREYEEETERAKQATRDRHAKQSQERFVAWLAAEKARRDAILARDSKRVAAAYAARREHGDELSESKLMDALAACEVIST